MALGSEIGIIELYILKQFALLPSEYSPGVSLKKYKRIAFLYKFGYILKIWKMYKS